MAIIIISVAVRKGDLRANFGELIAREKGRARERQREREIESDSES